MKIVKSWDNIWDTVFSNQEWGKYPDTALIQFIARNFYSKVRPQVKILEIGCGPGANIWYLDREGFLAYGIDGSSVAIEKAKQRIPNANLCVGDITKLEYDDNFFDAVIDCECLYANNTSNSELILTEINRVLKKDGFFYSRTFSNSMYVGNEKSKPANYEYKNVEEGPLQGKGFVRLIDRQGIKELYGNQFDIISIDKLEYTQFNEKEIISEWIIISKKK